MAGRGRKSKIGEMESNGYKSVVLGLRGEGKSHGYIARYVSDDKGIDPGFTVSQTIIGSALGVWGDPNYRPPKSVTPGSRKRSSIRDFRGHIQKLVESDGSISIKGIEKCLRSKGYRPSQGEVSRYVRDDLGIELKGGKEFLYPWDSEL